MKKDCGETHQPNEIMPKENLGEGRPSLTLKIQGLKFLVKRKRKRESNSLLPYLSKLVEHHVLIYGILVYFILRRAY